MFSRHITISAKINYKGHQPNSCYCVECIINRCSRHISSRSNVSIHLLPEWDPLHVLLLQRMRIIYSGEQQPGVVPHSGKHLITCLILSLPERYLRTQTSVQALFISILSGISLYAWNIIPLCASNQGWNKGCLLGALDYRAHFHLRALRAIWQLSVLPRMPHCRNLPCCPRTTINCPKLLTY